MQKIAFNGTELRVSELGLGTVKYGTDCPREAAFEQMDVFLDAGGNFIDTALVYGDWGPEPGSSEKTIGAWMRERGTRSRVVLATKGCHPRLDRPEVSRVSPACVHEDVESSLRNLGTDYIDLYFLHRDNPQIPVGELLESLEEEVKKGNIRYYGCSNWSLDRVKEAREYAAARDLKGFSCNQLMYTLAKVKPETLGDLMLLDEPFFRFHEESGMNFTAYMCQAGGYFEKRLAGRPVSEDKAARYASKGNDQILEKLREFCGLGYACNDFMLHYVRMAPFPAIPLGGFRTRKQLLEAIRGIERRIPESFMKELMAL